MTTKVFGHTFSESGAFEPISCVFDGWKNFNLHEHYAWAGLEVEDMSERDESAHFKIKGINPDVLSEVVVQFSQEGNVLEPEHAKLGTWKYIVPENLTARVIGATTEKGTPILNISYERPASTQARDRR